MDRKDPSRFEYINKNPNSNDSNEKISGEKLPSSDFWASRGNMGEKINILIGLNLALVNLISSLILNKEDVLTDDKITSINDTLKFL
ncbi:MAG: hypothetical protein ACFFC6_15620, partial [Promethearchaeota archaeon]